MLVCAWSWAGVARAQGAAMRPDQHDFHAIFRTLVETDTSYPAGDCTQAARRMLAFLQDSGFGSAEAEVFVPEGHPKEGGLVARLAGTDPSLGAMLLVDHIDVVEADARDWGRDPFRLLEKDGYFIARGVIDDKALAAIWVDSLIRMKKAGFRPRRTIKVALTCGEESSPWINGVNWLIENRPETVTADFALNEGGHGVADSDGKPLALYLAVGEKQAVNFEIAARSPGGHSSRPTPDNAIDRLASALLQIKAAPFPVRPSPTTQAYFARMSGIVGGDMGRSMAAFARDPDDAVAMATLTGDVTYNAMLRTTCVPTVVSGGGATNALPQNAMATIQCRLLPGDDLKKVRDHLANAIADTDVTLSLAAGQKPDVVAVPPRLDTAILGPAEEMAGRHFPGIPVVPNLLTAGTDGKYLSTFGVPTYGVPGIVLDGDGNGAHGVNEKIRIDSIYRGRDYLYDLLMRYAKGG
ncbi:MAG: M20/M25/M40 family metallo-hydrolase [Novosphingobium sp.]|nr:M20/M25/M40 family metallo-hydrolase [Novosphingobium sp.]